MSNKKLCPPALDGLIWLWKTSAIMAKNQEKGNTLIIAIALGLIMIATTSLSLLNSSKDKTNAQAGEFTQQAMAVAELGVARTHDFLAKNSKIAEYPLADWAAQAGTMENQGTFTNTSSTNSTCTVLTTTGDITTTVASLVDTFKTSGDNVVSSASAVADFRKGAFKVTDYTLADASFNPVSSVNPNSVGVGQIYGHGILTVQSQINPTANSSSDLFASNSQSSLSKVQVAIPLKRATAKIPLPGVWISDQKIGSPSNSIINATLLVPNCTNMALNIKPGNSIIISSIEFPDLPPAPVDTHPNYYNLGDITDSITLPRSGDIPIPTNKNGTMVDVYTYKVNNVNFIVGDRITIIPGREVDIHLHGNIDIGGSQVIDNSCSDGTGYSCNTTTNVVTYSSPLETGTSLFRRENLRILGHGANTGPATSQEPHICLSGGAEVFGFVFAPDYAVGAAGIGGNGFTGAVWARMFNPPSTCGSNTGQVVVVQDITNWNSVGLTPKNVPPQIGTITKWERK
jgi:hypothetical protein